MSLVASGLNTINSERQPFQSAGLLAYGPSSGQQQNLDYEQQKAFEQSRGMSADAMAQKSQSLTQGQQQQFEADPNYQRAQAGLSIESQAMSQGVMAQKSKDLAQGQFQQAKATQAGLQRPVQFDFKPKQEIASVQAQGDVRTQAERELAKQRTETEASLLTSQAQAQQMQMKQDWLMAAMEPSAKTAVLSNLMAGQYKAIADRVRDINDQSFQGAVQRQDAEQKRATETFYELLSLAGSAEDIETALQFGASAGLSQQTLDAIASNPDAWKRLLDQNRRAFDQQRSEVSANWMAQNDINANNSADVARGFSSWLNEVYSSDPQALLDAGTFYNPSEDAIQQYEEAFGALLEGDLSDPEVRAKMYAFDRYKKDLKTAQAVTDASEVGTILANSGIDATQGELQSVSKWFEVMNDASDAKLKKLLRDGGANALDPENGLASIYFEDWLGNSITSQEQIDGADDVNKKLNEAWVEYKRNNGSMNRADFFEAVGGTGVDLKASGKQLAEMLMTPSALYDAGDINAIMTLAEDPSWMNNNSIDFNQSRSFKYRMAYKASSGAYYNEEYYNATLQHEFSEGQVFTNNGKSYIVTGVPDAKVEMNTFSSDKWKISIPVIDLATGQQTTLQESIKAG